MPTNEEKVINAAEVSALAESGYSDWRDLVRVAVRAYERLSGAAFSYIVPLPNSHAPAELEARHANRVWKEFWVPIFTNLGLKIPGPTEALTLNELAAFLEQVKRELYDCHTLMHNVSVIYYEVTGHQVSKPMTDPYLVGQLAHEYFEGLEREDLWEWFESLKEEGLETIDISVLHNRLESHFGVRSES